MLSDLTGLAAYTQWQTREIDYQKYRFWVSSSRLPREIEATFELPKRYGEDIIRDYLEDWVRQVYPMFDYTDAHVNYGWE